MALRRLRAVLLLSFLAFAMRASFAAAPKSDVHELDAAIRRYNDLVLAMNHAGIAAMFAEDGELMTPKGPIGGPKAIRGFLESFKGYHVEANETKPTSAVVKGNAATQTGTFWQRVTLPNHQTVETRGRFQASWVKRNGRWLIRRMATTPERPPAR